jgi:hypothetical protein
VLIEAMVMDGKCKGPSMTEICFEAMEPIVVKVRVTDAAIKRQQQLLTEGRCIGCEEKIAAPDVRRRGLCNACYQAARTAVRDKRISETQLVREGKMLPPSKGGRPATNKFTRELSEL